MKVVEAWDLIGHHGEFRLVGGRTSYEAVCYNDDRARGTRVRLARLEASADGVKQINRWVDADALVEVIVDYDEDASTA